MSSSSGLYNIISGFGQKLGNIFPRVKRLGFTPALIGINRYRYCGPLNSLNQAPATNRTDAICERHDKEYESIDKMNITPQEKKQRIFESDRQFLRDQKANYSDPNTSFGDKLMSRIAYAGIATKAFFDGLSNEPALEYG